jgi:tetratricopeptide (TPR) repeat protein
MRKIFYIVFLSAVVLPCIVHSQSKESKGRAIVQAAVAYQSKLQDSTVTLEDVLQHWRVTARDPEVRKDQDALAIAYGCEALIEIQKGESHKADSLFRKALPLFRFKSSKESILVAYAEFERGVKNNADAMRAYDEIVHTMDSVGALWDIEYYRLSGYAPYAYAIDASFGMAQIAVTDQKQKKKAIELLQNTFDRHPNDALGMMTIVALHRLGAMDDEAYKFQVDLLCSRKPELRNVNDLFEKKFKEAK